MTNATVVVLTCGLLIYATTEIKVLKYSLMNITSCNNPQDTYKKIIMCAKHHADIIRLDIAYKKCITKNLLFLYFSYVKLVESTLSVMLGIQFLSCTIVLCMSTFLLTVVSLFNLSFI